MSAFIIIIGYFVAYAVLLWYITCTIHKKVPAILTVLYFILCMIPVVNYVIVSTYPFLYFEVFEDDIKLKNNWFNRTFLAYNAE